MTKANNLHVFAQTKSEVMSKRAVASGGLGR